MERIKVKEKLLSVINGKHYLKLSEIQSKCLTRDMLYFLHTQHDFQSVILPPF